MSKFFGLCAGFRFRLRTLLLVMLLAIPCAWLGSQWKLVRERAALIERVRASSGLAANFSPMPVGGADCVDLSGSPTFSKPSLPAIRIEPGDKRVPISTIRRWMGDVDVNLIVIPSDFPDGDEKRILDLFPGAEIMSMPFNNSPDNLGLDASRIPVN